jgi:hypothetical protein
MSTALWFAVAAGIVIAIASVRVFRAITSARNLDVGSVSNQWIAAHRVESGHMNR